MPELDLSDRNILLVDDVVFARATVKKILSSFGRPQVIEAAHGDEALDYLNSTGAPAHMIVSDFNMPKKNGLELLKAIRCGHTDYPRDFPVAMLTGYSDEHLVDMALSLDVNAFLIKPISRDTMGVRLGKMLDMASDTGWLKPVADYESVAITTAEADTPAPKPAASAPTPSSGKPNFVAANRAVSRLSGKFSDAELADAPTERRSGPNNKFDDPDLATREVMGRLSSLVGRLEDPNSAREVAIGFQKLVADGDRDVAKQLVTVLDTFEKRGVISSDDIARVFSGQEGTGDASLRSADTAPTKSPSAPAHTEAFTTLDAIEEGSVLARPLHTPDGSVLLADGTALTSQVLAVLKKLDDLDLLLLEAISEDADSGRGVFVKMPEAAAIPPDKVKVLPLHQVPIDTVLARDIHLADGRLYMTAGTVLSRRLLSLLQDLVELDRFDGSVSVVD